MKIGKRIVPSSAISTANADTIVVRGADLCLDLIGQVNFGDYFYFLLTGKKPDSKMSALLNACMVAIGEHGMVPSIQAARMTLAAAPDALQGAVASGILGCGSVILGASETAGRLFLQIEASAANHGGDIDAAAREAVLALRANRQSVPGYGHPLHKHLDPRVKALFDLSKKVGAGQRYVDIALAVENAIPGIVGKPLKLNVSSAIPAVLLGEGFPVNALKGVPMLARTASLIAHMSEEFDNPIGFALSNEAIAQAEYTGAVPNGFVASH